MRICLLTDEDLDAPPETPDWRCDPRPYLPEAEWTVETLTKEGAVRQVIRRAGEGYDVFFNLCDGAWDEGTPGVEVVRTLEMLDVPFTGADSRFFEPSREAMKRVCAAWDVPTPPYVIARNGSELRRAVHVLRFPLIVKHPSSYASVGLTPQSVVDEPEALLERGREAIGRYGAALIEEFVSGREFTVLVAENPEVPDDPTTYAPVEFVFPEGERFKHERLKWVDYRRMEEAGVADPELEATLRQISARFFRGLGGAGFGRCDIRVDPSGRPWMLEINPNCGIYYPYEDPGSADLCLRHDPAGHEGFTRRLVRAALARHERRRRGWEVRARPDGEGGFDYGIHATRGFRPGERILAFEERPHVLVTRSRVESAWEEPSLSWFHRYAWPLTDEVYVVWSDDPEAWHPVNHSCEPTAWLDGLDVSCRLPVEPGDEVTLDYATFAGEIMPEFACRCGTDACRGVITGEDHLAPFVERYGTHVSDWVRAKREGEGV